MDEFSDKNSTQFIEWLNRKWGFCFQKQRPDIDIEGSPQRTVSRSVIQDQTGNLFLIEKFSKNKFKIRQTVACAVNYLNQHGLETACGYQKTSQGEFLPFWKGHCYGLSSFLSSSVLVRPDYLDSSRIGNSFALFFKKMNTASFGIESSVPLETFSLKNYIYTTFDQMKQFDPKAHKMFSPFLVFLENQFMAAHDQFPLGFCHGDLHPLNVIWRKDQIKAVIDWEFLGLKPQIYDAANLVGCAGIENPEGLVKPMVLSFLSQLQNQNIFDNLGWQFFLEYVLALRFAWLSEWLRKKDQEMIEMEAAFMKILVDHMGDLKRAWEI